MEEAITYNKLDIKRIKENLLKLERIVPLKIKGDIENNKQTLGQKVPLKIKEASNKDKRNVLYINQHPSDVESLSAKATGTGSKLKRRKKTNKPSLRSQLKGVIAKPKQVKPTSTKRKSIDKVYNSRNFVIIKRHWNSLFNLKTISDLKEKQNKTLDTSILATKALLSGRLSKIGITLDSGWKRNLILPKDFDLSTEEINLHWLLEKITLFDQILGDRQLYPANKHFISKLTLGDFILGTERGQYDFPSVLFDLCCGELKTSWEDPNPKETKSVCFQYNQYTQQDKSFSGTDLKHLSQLGGKILAFSKSLNNFSWGIIS